MSKRKKIRADLRKKHESRVRQTDLTRSFQRDETTVDDIHQHERVSGKGELTRKRTVVGEAQVGEESGVAVARDVAAHSIRGRVLSGHGLTSVVHTESGKIYRCATRRLLKALSTDQRHVVAAGDHVWIRPEGDSEGFIERIEPRHSVLSRTSKGRQHVIVSNIDQLVIVTSLAEPTIKPNLIDRYLITAEKIGVPPVLCLNKTDLVDPAEFQSIAGVYAQLGYEVIFVSANTGLGMEQLRRRLTGCESVVAGQSGVGKSSLLNALEPGLGLRVGIVSEENQKGKHTTTTARLFPLSFGGYVVDTPGIRQFQLWDVTPEEVAGYFRDLRPYANNCRFPNCSHTHELYCAVKDAVGEGRLDARRYESYCHIRSGDDA